MEPAAASAPAFDKPPSRCAQPGHKKAQQSEQLRELSRGAAAAGATAKASAPAAAHASVFSLAASAGLMDVFLEVDPDTQARVLEKWAQHNKEIKHRHG